MTRYRNTDQPDWEVEEDELEDLYRGSLDDVMGDGYLAESYGAARILEAVDPIAYRVGLSDYESEWEEIEEEEE